MSTPMGKLSIAAQKMYDLAVEIKNIQCDIVSNEEKYSTTEEERRLVVDVWNHIDDLSLAIHKLSMESRK